MIQKRRLSPVFFLAAASLCASCAFIDAAVNRGSMKRGAGNGEAEVVVMRARDKLGGRLGLYVDGQKTANLREGQSFKLVIPQGPHTLFAEWERSQAAIQGSTVQFIARVDRAIFRAKLTRDSLELLEEGRTALGPGGKGEPRSSLDNAIERSFTYLADALGPVRASTPRVVSVVSISSPDQLQGDFIAGELTRRFVAAEGYTVVERGNLGALRSEKNLQLAGDVDDGYVADIGKELGAAIVITGKVFHQGPSNLLELKALDVKTAAVLGSSRERF